MAMAVAQARGRLRNRGRSYPWPAMPLERQLSDTGPIWADIVAKHGLVEARLGKLAVGLAYRPGFGPGDRGSNGHDEEPPGGFHEYQPTLRSFLDLFARLRKERIIP